MGFYAPAQLVQDVRRYGVTVLPVAANHSDWDCTLERGANGEPGVRLGLRLVRNLGPGGAKSLLAARAAGPFSSLTELVRRTQLSRRDLNALARADALHALSGQRRQTT
jgi:error-prone DNA polymerase